MPVVGVPAVSVLMPVRNEERYLPQAVDSLRRQTLQEWELVVVDDGSTDATVAILADAADKDSRIRVLRNPGRGLVPALNHGLASCRAPLVARMDGDDISHPCRLARQAEYLQGSAECGLVTCSFRHFPRHNLKVGMLAYETWQNSLIDHGRVIDDLYVESPFVHPAVMFRREAVERVGGYRDMGWAEDYDLWLRLASAGVRFARICDPLFFWRDRPERATRTMGEYSAEAFRSCKLHHLRNGLLSGTEQVILAGAGKEGRAWQRILAANGISVSHWVDVDPRKQGRTLHGATVHPPEAISPLLGRMLVTVGTRGARDGIRKWAVAAGFVEGQSFICVT
ncbi:MAG TPA: glycosyltransferase [Geobacteraceae bacterium]|nr:glycosyltransferase [Geobacteraceae bacterium]